MEEEPMARQKRGWTVVAAAMLTAALVTSTVRVAAAEEEHRFATDFGLGVGAIFTNLLYMPTKFVYSTLGGITGGFAYVLTGLRMDIAKAIWVPSMGGTYVVTPSMLKGDDKIYFSGTTQPKHAGNDEEDLPSGKPDDKRKGESY
jgi:hypothetical protein